MDDELCKREAAVPGQTAPTVGNGGSADPPLSAWQAFALQSSLLERLLEGGGLDCLVGALAGSMKCCAAVEDSGASVLSFAFPPDCPAELRKIVGARLSVQSLSSFKSLARDKKPGRAIAFSDGNGDTPVCRLVVPIQIAGEHAGWLSLIRAGSSFSEGEALAAEGAALIAAVQLSHDRKIADIELRLRGNFIEDLIFNFSSLTDPESIYSRARALRYDISKRHRVLVAEIENYGQIERRLGGGQRALAGLRLELVKCVQSRLDLSARGLATWHNNEIIMLVDLAEADGSIDSAKSVAEDIIRDASRLLKAKVFIGIGCVCGELADYSKSYLSAKKALEIGEYMITEGQVRSLELFKVHELFLSTLRPSELFSYARKQLDSLLEYDKKRGTDLIKTLQEYLYLRNSVERTAKSLNMSVSGLKYRLKKIEKILGADLGDYKTSFDLQLALVILQLFGEYRPCAQDVP